MRAAARAAVQHAAQPQDYRDPAAAAKPADAAAIATLPRVAIVEPVPRITPLQRLEALLDEGSLQQLRSAVRSRRMGEKARDGDGVIVGHGRVAGRPVCCYAQDGSYAGGSLGESHADSIVEVLRLAGRARVPVIGFIESAGARMQEGLAALSGYGRIFREHVALSGRVPQISILCGPSAGGACYGPALTDFVIMSAESAMFLTGPSVISEVTGEQIDIPTLGGPRVHERNGVCHLTATTDADAALLARELLAHLPQHRDEAVPALAPAAPLHPSPEPLVPRNGREVYDVRTVIAALVDGGCTIEISPRFARNVVCALARLDGRAVGVIANQPRYLGGVLDVDASQKASRFVRTCNTFGLPLVVLVDTPGFLPGSKQERDGVIRHGAKLVHAFAEASVPSVTVVLRKAFGGAFIAMNSKALGADHVFAWEGAELGVMGAGQAVGILQRREIAAAADPGAARDVFAQTYAAEHLHVQGAGADGFVDEVISPASTRQRIAGAFELLAACGDRDPLSGNIPL